jgi:HSP20 family protein
MSNIVPRKENTGAVARPQNEWEPIRMMRDFFGWDPFREMLPTFAAGDAFPSFAPAFEVKETKEGYVFKADLPGVKTEDIDISCSGNRLSIRGKREAEKEEKNDTFYTYERSYGSFSRAFTLPAGADMEHVKAELKEGVLTIALNKKPELQPKKVVVQAPQPKT